MNKEKNNPSKCPICGRPTHKKLQYCIFHASAEVKTEEDFKRELKKYVNKIKKEDGDYDFREFIFIGNIDFRKDLNVTVFKNANFLSATFKGDAWFGDVTFKGNADFGDVTFEGNTLFIGVTFERGAIFINATFELNTFFIRVTFESEAFFLDATFKENTEFKLKYLVENLNLYGAKVFPGKKWLINVNNGKGEIFFQRAYLENTYLDIELGEGVFIDFTDTLLRNTKIEKGKIENHILQEKEKKFSEAKEIFLLLKNNFHSIGRYEDESWAFIKEKDMDRFSNSLGEFVNSRRKKSLFKKILLDIKKSSTKRIIVKFRLFKKWLFSKKAIKQFNLSVSNYIFQYGENPWLVIRFASM